MPVTRDQAIGAIAAMGKANMDKMQAMLKANADMMATSVAALSAQMLQQNASFDQSGELVDCLHALGVLNLDDVAPAAHLVAITPTT